MLMFWKHCYCENVHTTQSNLQIQCNCYRNTCSVFHRTRTNNLKIHMEPQKTPNSQSNPENAKQSLRHHYSRLQAMLQSCSHQDSMVLAQKQTYRSMEQNKKSRNGPTTIQSTNLQQSRKEQPMDKRQSLQQMVLGKQDSNMQKNGPFSYTIQIGRAHV